MKMNKISLPMFVLILSLLFVMLTGCNASESAEGQEPPKLNVTQAYETVNAELTQAVAQTPVPPTRTPIAEPLASATPSPEPISEISPTITQAPSEPTETFLPTFTHTPGTVCDQAAAAYPSIDITIPDDTEIPAGQSFTKVWRVLNTGTCNWTAEYTAIFVSGDQMQAPEAVNISEPVAPGQSVDIEVTMIAPAETGTYQGNWKLRNASGQDFGIGAGGNDAFWVRIVVVEGSASPTQTPTPGPTPQTLVSGSVNLSIDQSVDLDTLQINASGSDLVYQQTDEVHELNPLAGVSVGIYGAGQPTFSQCQGVASGAASIDLEDTAVGTHFCYLTNQGLPGWGRLDAFDIENGIVTITILTWATLGQ